MKLNRKVKRNKADSEINGTEMLRKAMYAKYSGSKLRTHKRHTLPPPPPPPFCPIQPYSEYFTLQRIIRLTEYSISCNWRIQHFARGPPTVQHSYTVSITYVTVTMHWCICQTRQVVHSEVSLLQTTLPTHLSHTNNILEIYYDSQ
jgi:hypothetical protein